MKKFFKAFLLIVLVGFVTIFIYGYRLHTLPTTAEMKSFFASHQSAFRQKNGEILSRLKQHQPISFKADPATGYRWIKISPAGEDQYQQPVIVRYYTHQRGIGVGGFGTGIAYIDPEIKIKSYPSLEAMKVEAKKVEGFIGYTPIAENWYLFFWEAD